MGTVMCSLRGGRLKGGPTQQDACAPGSPQTTSVWRARPQPGSPRDRVATPWQLGSGGRRAAPCRLSARKPRGRHGARSGRAFRSFPGKKQFQTQPVGDVSRAGESVAAGVGPDRVGRRTLQRASRRAASGPRGDGPAMAGGPRVLRPPGACVLPCVGGQALATRPCSQQVRRHSASCLVIARRY